MTRYWSTLLVVVLAILAGCSYEAFVIFDVGMGLNTGHSRDIHLATEAALERIGFLRTNLPAVGMPEMPRLDDDRYVMSYFRDPKSPGQPPHRWHVQVLLEKDTNSVQVVFIQPGARQPSEGLSARSDEVLSELRDQLSGIPIRRRDLTR